MDRETYSKHGRVIARVRVHADGYAVMSLEIEVPSPDVVGLVKRYLDDSQNRPVVRKAVSVTPV